MAVDYSIQTETSLKNSCAIVVAKVLCFFFFLIYFLIGGYCFRLLCWFLQYSRVNYLMDSVWYLLGLTAREF